MAEALLKEKLMKTGSKGFSVSSCGLNVHREKMDPNLPLILGSTYENITDFHTKQISAELVNQADLILAMEESHVKEILRTYPLARGKVFTVTSYANETGDIKDYDNNGDFLGWLRDSRYRLDNCIRKIWIRLPY